MMTQQQLQEVNQKLLKNNIDISPNDLLVLADRYKLEKDILANAKEFTFDNKLINWYNESVKLHDTDRFTPARKTFLEHGKYTNAIQSTHPKSEYITFWQEEMRRCKFGYHVGDDWITGYHYFYLNYTNIELVEESIENGVKYTNRVVNFPEFWDSDYYFFHYVEEARRKGLHCLILKKRGAGMSWKFASMMNRNYHMFPNSRSQVYANDNIYILGDGIIGKAWSIMAFIDNNTQFKKHRHLKNTEKHRQSGYREKLPDGTLVDKGWMSEIIGTSLKDDVHKVRGKRSMLVGFEEFGSQDKGEQAWEITTPSVEQSTTKTRNVFGQKIAFGCVCAGTKVWTNNGNLVNIEDLKQEDGIIGYDFCDNEISQEPITYIQEECYKECIRLVFGDRILECSIDHPIAVSNRKFIEAYKLNIGDEILIVNHYIEDGDINISADSWYEHATLFGIEYIGVKRIYNLTANKTHTYIANGIITHNTGGEENASFDAMKKMIYKPELYNILSVPNLWDENMRDRRVGYFIPEYVSMSGFIDEFGNSMIKEARQAVDETRESWLSMNIDSYTLAIRKAEYPKTIQEAILRTDGSIFPVADIREQLGIVSTSRELRESRTVGTLVLTNLYEVRFEPDITSRLKPIETTEVAEGIQDGAVIVYEHPAIRPKDNVIPEGRYIIGTDPIDFGALEVGKKHSLGVTYVMDTWTERIAASYIARPEDVNTFYETTRRLCLYYNAKAMYENNLKGLYTYFVNRNSEWLLADEPKMLKDKLEIKSYSNRKKGFTASDKILQYGRLRIKNWIIKIDDNDQTKTNLNNIRDIGLLEELISWNKDGNFDRVSALIGVMLYLDEVERFIDKANDEVATITKTNFFRNVLSSRYAKTFV